MTEAIPELTPYSTVRPLMGILPTWMDEYDAQRITSYQVYEQIYKNVPQTFKLVARGSEDSPIYVPTGRTIIDTTNRFTARGLSFTVDPEFGTPEQQTVAREAFRQLFARERWRSKFNSAKRFGLIRGDWAFHIVADPEKPAGRRISLYAIDPGSLFVVPHPDDIDRIQAYHIVDQWEDPETGDMFIKRQTYSKGPDPYDPEEDDGRIWSSLTIHNMDDWNDPSVDPVIKEIEPFALPPQITALPVYHIRHKEEPGNPWGTSELQGFERIMAAINQSVSDEELALALEGLGMYGTTAGPPTDEDGNDTDWILGPGRVLELGGGADAKVADMFARIDGVKSIEPMQSHIKMLFERLYEASNTPDVARGKVEVQVAESGIAIELQMHPMLAKTEETEDGISDVLTQMYFDLKGWFSAYESLTLAPELVVAPTFGPKLPVNVKAKVAEVLEIVSAGLASDDWGRNELAKYGYVFPEDEGNNVIAAKQARALAEDPYALRATQEMDDNGADQQ